MFHQIKLFFTNRKRYEEYNRYLKRQKTVRKKLKKLAKEFCPWSGYYIHEMVKTMIEFYDEVYTAGDWCWRAKEYVQKNASALKAVRECSDKLDALEDMDGYELVPIAEIYSDFADYCAELAAKLDSKEISETIKCWAAYEFLEKKYTTTMYTLIGEHIWEWCD